MDKPKQVSTERKAQNDNTDLAVNRKGSEIVNKMDTGGKAINTTNIVAQKVKIINHWNLNF